MKQATKKLFRNCPYKDVEFKNCSECTNYKRCMNKKRVRRAKRVEHFLNVTLPLIMVLATLVTAISAIIMCVVITTAPEKSEGTNNTIATNTNLSDVVESEGDTDSKEESSTDDIPEEVEVEAEVKDSTTEEEQKIEAKLSAEGPSETYYYHLSEQDKLLIAKLVWAEARGESFEGKTAVAAVVINRYFYGNNRFGNSIKGVITASGQFASIKDVTMADLKAVPECMEAVEAACKGWDPTREVFQEGALFFYAPKGVKGYQKEIREGIKIMVIGNHNFHVNFEKVR